jgi:putative tryptophan/tyrosine transport system substrate-binding protein
MMESKMLTWLHFDQKEVLHSIRTAVAGVGSLLIARFCRLPAVYPLRFFASEGGLIAYGPDIVDEFRLAAGYVDRILKGEKPGDLPVQTPTKYELVINLKTAKALGLIVPPSMQLLADEVIE